MKRIGILALAACAAIVLTATVGAGTAAAARFITESGSTVRKGTTEGTFHINEEIGCEGQTLTGSATEIFFANSVSGASCTVFVPAPLKMNGCTFIFNPGAEESPNNFGGTFNIGSPGCGPITIANTVSCELSIYPKEGLTAHYINKGLGTERYVTVTLSASGLKQTGKIGICNNYNNEKGTWNATWNLKDYNSEGVQKGVYLSALNGLYIAGEESTEESKQPKFHTEKFDANINGNQNAVSHFTLPKIGKITCETMTGTGHLFGPTSLLGLQNLNYGGCVGFGRQATVKSEGCQDEFVLANSNEPYTGTLKLACEVGHALEVSVYVEPGVRLCTVSFPSQTLGTVNYKNESAGAYRRLTASSSGTGLQYTVSGGGGKCGTVGSYSNGEGSSGTTLIATV